MQVVVKYDGVAPVESEPITIKVGEVSQAQVTVRGAAELRDKPFVAVLAAGEGSSTSQSVVHLFGRTVPGNHVTVGGKEVEVFTTGNFATIPSRSSPARIALTSSHPMESRVWTRTLTINRTRPNAPTHQTSAESARSSSTQPAEVAENRIVETTGERTGITYGLHSVRLGGPWLAWVPRERDSRLSPGRPGTPRQTVRFHDRWVSQDEVRFLPAGTAPPHNYFTSCEVERR